VVEILERLVYLVNSGGSEFGVTIIVRGQVISGLLTPNQRFQTWMRRTLDEAATAKGGTMKVSDVDESRMSEDETEAVKRAWRRRVQDALDEASSDAVQNLRHSQDNFCLRNATIWGSSKGLSEVARVAYLMLDLHAVEGCTLGWMTRAERAPVMPESEE